MKMKLKRIVSCILSITICFVTILSYSNYHLSAAPSTPGIMFGQYYRLRHADSNLYLTMNSTSDIDNMGCSLQARSSSNAAQIFYLDLYNSSNAYSLSPLSSSSRKVLSLSSSATSNNIPIVLKSNTSANTQKWNISQTTRGYAIKSFFNSKAISPRSFATAVGTPIVSYDYSLLNQIGNLSLHMKDTHPIL